MAEKKGVPEGYKKLGETRRVLSAKLSRDDVDRINEKLHGLIDRHAEVEKEKKKFLDAVNGRLADIVAEQNTLHETWKSGEREELVVCLIFRDDRKNPPEIVTLRADTHAELSRRPMSNQERQQLLKFDHAAEGGSEHVEELNDAGEEATEFMTRQSEHEARVSRLLARVDLSQFVAEVESQEAKKDAEDDVPMDAPKGRGRGRKGAKKTAAKTAAKSAKKTAKGRGRKGKAAAAADEHEESDG